MYKITIEGTKANEFTAEEIRKTLITGVLSSAEFKIATYKFTQVIGREGKQETLVTVEGTEDKTKIPDIKKAINACFKNCEERVTVC